ncbi:MAG: glycosyltransferase, partial [Actinomycetota bacterium]|nr:glycosyltransferase [Actinomycetota bacterium]
VAGDDVAIGGDVEPSVLFVGRHEERKGLSTLLEAVTVLEKDLDYRLACHIIGRGPDTDSLRSSYADPELFRWHGQVSESEKMLLLKSATAFVAPALRGESFGVVLLEAMASSTAVIASDIPGYRNVATNGTDSVLVEPGNAVELASAIKAVLTDTAYRDRLVSEGLKTAASMSVDRLAMLYEERYRMVLNSRA